MDIKEFITESNRIGSESELATLFCDALEQKQFHPFIRYTENGLEPAVPENPNEKLLHVQKFISGYYNNRFSDSDPVAKLYPRTTRPFAWDEVERLSLSPAQRAAMQLRRDTGVTRGICLPTRQFSPETIGMTLVSFENGPISKDLPYELYAMINQYLLRRQALQGKDTLQMPDIELSPREKEILVACSQGKTNVMIGKALGITERTVEFHLASVFKKLRVNNRTMAVVKAVNLRMIHI